MPLGTGGPSSRSTARMTTTVMMAPTSEDMNVNIYFFVDDVNGNRCDARVDDVDDAVV